jgi:hypothetical protein
MNATIINYVGFDYLVTTCGKNPVKRISQKDVSDMTKV